MSKTNQAVKAAAMKGYRVNDLGEVFSSQGKKRKLRLAVNKNDRRYQFSVYLDSGEVYPVAVHKLQAYQKFGDVMFAEGMVVRHLDGNSTNNKPDNIAIGTASDNAMDQPADVRKARSAHAVTSITRTDWAEIEADYFERKMGFKKLRTKWGVSLGTLSNRFNNIAGWKPMESDVDWEAVRTFILESGSTYRQAAEHFGCSDRSLRRHFGVRKNLQAA